MHFSNFEKKLDFITLLFKKEDFSNTKWFVAEKIIQLIVGAFIVPKIFTTLGASEMGDLKYVMTIVGILTPIFTLGLMDISIREIVFHPKRSNAILSTSFLLQLFSWLILSIFLMTYVLLFAEDKLITLYIIIALSYLPRLSGIAEYYLLAIKKVKIIFIAKIISLLLVTLLQYYGVINQFKVEYFAIITAIDFVFQGLIYFFLFHYNSKLEIKFTRFSRPTAVLLLKSSYPLIITQLLLFLYLSLDKIFIKHFLNSESVGKFYSVKFLVITMTWSIGFAVINALYPSIAKSYQTNKSLYKKKMLFLLKVVSIYGILIVIFYNLLGEYILSNYFNETEQDTIQTLKIFCWAPLIVFIGMIYEKHIINNNKLYKDALRFALGIIINIVFSYLLIPQYGISGAAMAILISHLIINIGFIFIDTESRKQALSMLKI
jgi:O-antigen/teichoic acid export membrane protein